MNKFLAGAVGFLNILIAIVIITAGGIAGLDGGGSGGMLVGLALGFLVALIVCGLLALIIDIRNTLREMLEETRKHSSRV